MSNIPALAKLKEYEKMGLIRSQRHPTLPLNIFVYTEVTSFERLWNNVTMQCRGLVVDDNGRCIVRCLPKFFNEDEPHALCNLPKQTKQVYFDKLDGSLIQVTDDPEHGFIVTSKGSFNSKQSNWAKQIIEQNYPASSFYKGYTYVFELIHPENRIVLDYKGEKALYLLAVIETETGIEHSIYAEPFSMFITAPTVQDIFLHLKRTDVEGLVVKTGAHRYKVKTGEYIRLHRIMTEFTPKRVWEALASGASLEFTNMPEEFQAWLDDTVNTLRTKFNSIFAEAARECRKADNLTNKEIGLSQDFKYKHLVFQLRSGKDITASIYKMIKPKEEAQNVETNNA